MARKGVVNDLAFEASLICRSKFYLKYSRAEGDPSNFERHVSLRREVHRRLVHAALLKQYSKADVLRGTRTTRRTLKKAAPLILDASVESAGLSGTVDALERVVGLSPLGEFLYQPIKAIIHEKPTRHDKLLLAFHGVLLTELQGQEPAYGHLIVGPQLCRQRVKLQSLQETVRRMIADLRATSTPNDEPQLILNQHCPVCEYQAVCRDRALATDNLSLLAGVEEREIAAQNRKGIFTVNQLSYTFRYRKPSKRAKMLSVLETCRYNDVNFLRFLLGGSAELTEVLGCAFCATNGKA